MSWHATAFVKKMTAHPDGTKLTAREKLLLFVLADYHNEERNCAWAGLTTLATDSLTSRRHVMRMLEEMEFKGTLKIERREQATNFYRFTGLVPRDTMSLPRDKSRRPRDTAVSPPSDIAVSPEPLKNLHLEPTRYSQPSLIFEAVSEAEKTGEDADIILRRLRAK